MSNNIIKISGAKENNLKNISLKVPRDKLVVFTGLSGSGKTSLAFDTIYAEGQRRYMESLSSYSRQFLGQMEKPDVESIEGLSPAISIDQKTTSKNPRSTVGTVTEIYDYFRLLYARIGKVYCPKCGKPITRQTIDQIVDQIMTLPEKTRIQLMAPIVRGRKGRHEKILDQAKKSGYVRVWIDGQMYDLSEPISLEKNKKHSISIVVDRLIIKAGIEKRLTDSIETIMKLSGGLLEVDQADQGITTYSQNFACVDDDISMPDLEPRLFSFNNPFGACKDCHGLGFKMEFDPDLVIPDHSKSISQGAVQVLGQMGTHEQGHTRRLYEAMAKHYQFSLDTPFADYPQKIKDLFLYGSGGEKLEIKYQNKNGQRVYQTEFEGIIPILERRHRETSSEYARQEYESLMTNHTCPTCHGARLNEEALAVRLASKNISELMEDSIVEIQNYIKNLDLSERDKLIGEPILKEITARIDFLVDVGLDYLTLSRSAGTLSGGEAQRIRLATQIGSGLMGVLYILDEPSIGLHQRDNKRLLTTLKHLRDLGNTLIVVEHDEETMLESDYIVDIGPGAGIHGGEVVYAGSPKGILKSKKSVTGAYLSKKLKIQIPDRRRPDGRKITIVGASENNLKNIDVAIPLGVQTCITGVSGSGKSSLVNEILYKRLARDLNKAKTKPGKHKDILGLDYLDKVIAIDQSPIGRTPRSNPATYTGLFDSIRDLFAETNDAKMRGYKKGRFSFNVRGGRCEACRGDGIITIEMHFLPDIYVPCEVCGGARYNRETLEVRYKGKNIADVLHMTVEDALSFFENIPAIQRKMQTLFDVGLGYIKLGQASTTLSGGEAQRVKLATELSKRSTGKTLYILDEPTTGLHFEDVNKLVGILKRLVDQGNSVLVIEHNLDIIKTSDHIIDIGPEGGNRGGQIVAQGTPEEVARVKTSYTGQFLQDLLK